MSGPCSGSHENGGVGCELLVNSQGIPYTLVLLTSTIKQQRGLGLTGLVSSRATLV